MEKLERKTGYYFAQWEEGCDWIPVWFFKGRFQVLGFPSEFTEGAFHRVTDFRVSDGRIQEVINSLCGARYSGVDEAELEEMVDVVLESPVLGDHIRNIIKGLKGEV